MTALFRQILISGAITALVLTAPSSSHSQAPNPGAATNAPQPLPVGGVYMGHQPPPSGPPEDLSSSTGGEKMAQPQLNNAPANLNLPPGGSQPLGTFSPSPYNSPSEAGAVVIPDAEPGQASFPQAIGPGGGTIHQPIYSGSPPSSHPGSNVQKLAPSRVETYIPGAKDVGQAKAILRTSLGDITIELYSAYAPHTVRNFIALARGEKESVDIKTGKKVARTFYNGLTFHRVIKGFLIQTGCPFGTGRGGPGFSIPDEISPLLKHDKPGIVSMAPVRDEKGFQKNSAGSQFFITLAPQPDFDGVFTVFGHVTKGMDVVQKIANVKTGPTDRPLRRVFLNSVEVMDGTESKPKVDDPNTGKPIIGATTPETDPRQIDSSGEHPESSLEKDDGSPMGQSVPPMPHSIQPTEHSNSNQ